MHIQPKYKILSIVGARPNFVKAAPVSRALASEGCFEEVIVHTGQHYDYLLSEAFFKELDIPAPKYNLGIGSERQARQMGLMITRLDEVMEKESPDAVIVFGDTNSTAAGAIAASKNFIPVVHVEAGLREFNKTIPEEINKLLTDAVTDIFCAPTPTAINLLAQAGITGNVHHTGDVGIDLIHQLLPRIEANQSVFLKYRVQPGKYYFMTCHRAANTDNPDHLREILQALEQIRLPVIFPIHPRTLNAIKTHQLPNPASWPHVRLLPPVGFIDTQTLIRSAKMVITDSGGIAKEAYFHRTPGIIIDQQIEWVETVKEGWNYVTGPDCRRILERVELGANPSSHSECLGNGTAAKKIASILKNYLSGRYQRKVFENAPQ